MWCGDLFNAVGSEFVGLENYRGVLENEAFRLAAGNTVRFLIVCLPLLLGSSAVFGILLLNTGRKSGILKSGFYFRWRFRQDRSFCFGSFLIREGF